MQLVQGNFRANFHDSIGHRQRVIENGCVSKVSHGKVVEPLQGTSRPMAVLLILNAYLSGEHKKDLIT